MVALICQALQSQPDSWRKQAFTLKTPFLPPPNAKSDLRSFREVCNLAVQVSKKGAVFLEVSNIGGIRRAAFSNNEWDAKSDVLIVIWFQSSSNRRLFICDCKPLFLPLD